MFWPPRLPKLPPTKAIVRRAPPGAELADGVDQQDRRRRARRLRRGLIGQLRVAAMPGEA